MDKISFDSISDYFGYLFIINKDSIIDFKSSDFTSSLIFNKNSIRYSFVMFKESYNLHLIITDLGADISNALNILCDLNKVFSKKDMIKSPLRKIEINSDNIHLGFYKIRNDCVSIINPNYINIGYDIIPITLLGLLYFYIEYLSSTSFNRISIILPNEKYEYRISKAEMEGDMINLYLRSLANLQSKEIKINYDNIEGIKVKKDDKIAIKINLNNT